MGSMIEPLICPSLARGIRPISSTDIGVASGRKRAWMMFTLTHLQDSAHDIGRAGITCTLVGRFDPQVSRLVLATFIDSAELWDEEVFALGQLNRLGEERLALSALDLVANGWMAHDDTQVSERLIDIWKTFGWVIREREERPGKMDAAWSAIAAEHGQS